MIIQIATDEQRRWAYENCPGYAYRNDGDFAGDKQQRFAGLLAEVIVVDALGAPRPFPGRPDPGHDMLLEGLPIDIKTTRRTVPFKPSFGCNLAARQYRPTHAYLFTSLHKSAYYGPVLSVVGVLPPHRSIAEHHRERGSKVPRADGTDLIAPVDFYDIPIHSLEEPHEWTDLTGILAALAYAKRMRGGYGDDPVRPPESPDHPETV